MGDAAGDPLRVVVMAGPNGSGKSSLIEDLVKSARTLGFPTSMPDTILNPDSVRKEPNLIDQARPGEDLDITAQRVTAERRGELMRAQKSFAFETVMSHPSKLSELRQLRDAGYLVHLAFISTKHPDINVARVAYRVASNTTTGHDVDEARVRGRYQRTLDLLPAAIELADTSILWDNSVDRAPRSEQARIYVDRSGPDPVMDIQGLETPERWVDDTIARLSIRLAERQTAQEIAHERNAGLEFANPVAAHYQGHLIECGQHYFGTLALDPSGSGMLLTVHDYSMLTAHSQEQIRSVDKASPLHIATVIYRPGKEVELNVAENKVRGSVQEPPTAAMGIDRPSR